MGFKFEKASRKQAKARIALVGPSGSGKTYTALKMFSEMGLRIAVADTEHGSASKYAPAEGETPDNVSTFDFDALNMASFSPDAYVEVIHVAESEGYDVLVVDSLSHAWVGKDGALEQADKAGSRQGENRFTAWRHVTPKHNALIEAILACKCHFVGTMRTKTEYIIEENERGKKVPKKVGLAPVQRDGMEYEFDLVCDIGLDHTMVVSKSRLHSLADMVINKPDNKLGKTLLDWLNSGAKPEDPIQSIVAAASIVKTQQEFDDLRTRANIIFRNASEAEQEILRTAMNKASDILRESAQ